MEKWFLFVCAFLTPIYGLWADDTHIVVGAGGVGYFSEKEDRFVTLEYEKITLTFSDTSYSVHVDFDFNNGSDSSLDYDIGFPVVARDFWHKEKFLEGEIPLENFSTTVDGNPVQFEETRRSSTEGVSKWYTKKVRFRANGSTKIGIDYKAKYGLSGGLGSGYNATYFYGSAYIWKGPIGKFDILVENNSKFEINSVEKNGKYVDLAAVKFLDKTRSMISFHNLKPEKNDQLDVWLSQIDNYGFYSTDLNWIKTRFHYELGNYYFLTPEQLRIERNFFYAINGLVFKSKDLTDFFSKMPWYQPSKTNVDAAFTDEEKKAIDGISKIEKLRLGATSN